MTLVFGKIINKLEIKLMPKLRNLSEIISQKILSSIKII